RMRVLFGGKFVVDTLHERTSWEKPFYPTSFRRQASPSLLRKSEEARPEEGTTFYDLVVAHWVAKEAVTEFTGQGTHKELGGLLRLDFASAGAWFEEDERIYPKTHTRSPRIKIYSGTHFHCVPSVSTMVSYDTTARPTQSVSRPRASLPFMTRKWTFGLMKGDKGLSDGLKNHECEHMDCYSYCNTNTSVGIYSDIA
ncbi:hypothetical protein BS17DRAFT_704572, partial [Gyrodon lividus]